MAQMYQCPYCGGLLGPGAMFCPQCGGRLAQPVTPPTTAQRLFGAQGWLTRVLGLVVLIIGLYWLLNH